MNNIGERKSSSLGSGISHDIFISIISMENLYLSWKEFKKGKINKPDVQEFALNLENNLFQLHEDLKSKTYKHSHYTSFFINDPKRRHIHKACVRDRIVHHAIYRILYPIFDKTFIYDSYSCRNEKGTHKAVERLQGFIRRGDSVNRPISRATQRVAPTKFRPIVIKCDIKQFFASIDHDILLDLIKKKIKDEDALWLIKEIIDSFRVGAYCNTPLQGEIKQIEREREREREREYRKSGARNSAG